MPQDVKERSEPTGCLECGRPTWAASGVCISCAGLSPTAAAPVAPPVEPVAEPTRRSVRVDDDGRIAEELLCRGCGYNLRGLDRSAVCPECATPVDRSIRSDLLKFSDPAWMDRLARGMKLIIIGLLAGVGAGIVIAGLSILLAFGGTGMTTIESIAGPIGVVISLFTVVGTWLLTTPEAGRLEPEGRITVRRVARWCAVFQVASALSEMVGTGIGGLSSAVAGTMIPPTASLRIMWVVTILVQIVVLAGYIATLIYLRRLALRIPRPRLARHTRVVMWGYFSVQALFALTAIVIAVMVQKLIAAGTPMGATGISFVVPVCVLGIAALVFGIWAIVLLFQYRGAFQLASREARTAWEPGS